MAGLFIALFVDKCTACQSHWKSDFGWHRFQKWAYSLALAWGVRGLKSLKRSWNTWWPLETASRLVSLSNYCLWCFFVVFFSVSWSGAYGLYGLRLSVRNIPKFKDRVNWSRDTFQPMRSRACVYQQTNQNIAPVIKNFQNSGRSRTEFKMSLQ